MKRLTFILIAFLGAAYLAEARDLVSRALIESPRNLRVDVVDNPAPSEPPSTGGCENCTTLTATETVPTLTDGLVLIGVCQRSSTNIITSVSGSVDGALTLVSSANDAANPLVRANLYRLLAPTAGAQVFTVTSSAPQNMAMGIAYFSNVDQTTPLGSVTNTAGVNNASTTYSSATQRVVVDHLCAAIPNESTPTPGSGQEQKWHATAGINGSFTNRQSSFSQEAGAASVDMTWTKPANQAFIQQVIDVRPPGDTGTPPEPCASCYLLIKTFEDDSLTSGNVQVVGCDGGFAIVASPTRTGTKAVSIEVDTAWTLQSPECAGAETWAFTSGNLVRGELDRFSIGPAHGDAERWYGFSVYVPDSTAFPAPTANAADGYGIAQWHTNPDACDVAKSPHLALRVTNTFEWQFFNIWDANACTTSNPPNITRWNLGAPARDAWTDWVVYAKWSYTSSGILQVWKNGVLVIDKQNAANTYNDQQQEFVTVGIYNPFWGSNPPTPDKSATLYYDNWRVADSTGCFAAVDPSLAVPGGC